MSKKILIVTECFYPEEFKINDIAFSWRDKGYDVSILTQFPSYPEGVIYKGFKNKLFSKEKIDGLTIYRVHATIGYKTSLIKKLLKYFSFMILGTLVSLFIGRKYDYVFGFNMSALTGMLPALTIRKLYKKPLTLWVQDIWPDSVYAYGFKKTKFLSICLDWFVGRIYRNTDNIAISGKGFEYKLRSYSKKDQHFHYLPNWADDLDMSLPEAKFSDDLKTHFTFAGNVGTVQNLDNICKAFIALPTSMQSLSQLNIIGDGSYLEYLEENYKNDNIVFHGRKPRDQMASYYKASDFLIVSLMDKPIFSITVPAKTQTYIAAKKPILAVIEGDTRDIVSENNLGLTAHPSNIQEISEIMEKAINTTAEERRLFTKSCDKLLLTTYNKEKTIENLTNLLVGKN